MKALPYFWHGGAFSHVQRPRRKLVGAVLRPVFLALGRAQVVRRARLAGGRRGSSLRVSEIAVS
jgi:hypothetical protein